MRGTPLIEMFSPNGTKGYQILSNVSDGADYGWDFKGAGGTVYQSYGPGSMMSWPMLAEAASLFSAEQPNIRMDPVTGQVYKSTTVMVEKAEFDALLSRVNALEAP